MSRLGRDKLVFDKPREERALLVGRSRRWGQGGTSRSAIKQGELLRAILIKLPVQLPNIDLRRGDRFGRRLSGNADRSRAEFRPQTRLVRRKPTPAPSLKPLRKSGVGSAPTWPTSTKTGPGRSVSVPPGRATPAEAFDGSEPAPMILVALLRAGWLRKGIAGAPIPPRRPGTSLVRAAFSAARGAGQSGRARRRGRPGPARRSPGQRKIGTALPLLRGWRYWRTRIRGTAPADASAKKGPRVGIGRVVAAVIGEGAEQGRRVTNFRAGINVTKTILEGVPR